MSALRGALPVGGLAERFATASVRDALAEALAYWLPDHRGAAGRGARAAQ